MKIHTLYSYTIIVGALLGATMCHSFNILFVLDFFPHSTRPFIDNQIKNLIDRGHSVTIYVKKYKKENFVPAWVSEYDALQYVVYEKVPLLDKFDIVYCMLGHLAPEFAEIKSKTSAQWKLVTAFHGYEATGFLVDNPTAYDLLFKVGDLFLPVSYNFKNRLVKVGCSPAKIKVHRVGVDCSLFSFKTRFLEKNACYNIVSVGRLDPLKGYKYAIPAVAALINNGIKINYFIIGAGTLEKKLTSLIHSLGCENSIKLLGLRTQKEVAEILEKTHVVLLASATEQSNITEGVPVALMEAMARGIPVISTQHSGIPELVENGVSGFIVPEKNINALSERLQFLLEHPELWPLMGHAGRKHVEKEFNLHNVNKELEELLLSLLK